MPGRAFRRRPDSTRLTVDYPMSPMVKEILETLGLALVVFILVQASVQNFRVEGSSMSPTLEGRQYLLVNKLIYFRLDQKRLSRIIPFWQVDESTVIRPFRPPKLGEIIVFHFPRDPQRSFVKRVVGVPGDTVEIVNGEVRLNGEVHPEPYLIYPGSTDQAALVLKEKEYFVMGDNRRQSEDSRKWGPVPEDNILGRVWLVYWPFDQRGLPN